MRRCRFVFVLFLSLLLAGQDTMAREKAGVVLLARGDFHAERMDGRVPLRRRSPVFEGDVLVTGPKARAQVRLTDGTLIALHPGTRLLIERYHRDPAGGEERNFTRLLQGGFRTLTGLIGKRNPGAYRVATPVATIGVRGTHYEAVLGKGLEVGAYAGEVIVRNTAGTILLGPVQDFRFARIEAPDRPPVGLLQPPSSLRKATIKAPVPAAKKAAEQPKRPKVVRRQPPSGPETPARAVRQEAARDGLLPEDRPPLLQEGNLPRVPAADSPVRLPVVDYRFTPAEWDRLWRENRFGVVLWNRASPFLEGGRAIDSLSDDRPVVTSTGIPPFLPEFSNAPLRHVFRRGNAGLQVSQIVTVDATHEVHWGVWNGTVDPVLDFIDPTDPKRFLPVQDRVVWATVLPTRPGVLAARTDRVTLNTPMGVLGASSQGPLSAADITVTMDVDFAAGRITNGDLDIWLGADYWSLDFEGDIRGSFADLRLLQNSDVNGNPVDGVMGGVFTGQGGEALLQAFDVKDATDSTRWAQGLLLVK